MSIYKSLASIDDILEYDIKLIIGDDAVLENSMIKDIKGKKEIPIHILHGETVQHGPRYKFFPKNKEKSITFVTLKPNGKINLKKTKGASTNVSEYLPVAKAVIMATFDGAVQAYDTGDTNLIEKEVEKYNALSTEKKKDLIKRYNRKFL